MQQMSGMIRYRLCGASRCGARMSKQTRANYTYADATISHLGACILGIASSSRGVQQKEIQHWLGVDRRIKEGMTYRNFHCTLFLLTQLGSQEQTESSSEELYTKRACYVDGTCLCVCLSDSRQSFWHSFSCHCCGVSCHYHGSM